MMRMMMMGVDEETSDRVEEAVGFGWKVFLILRDIASRIRSSLVSGTELRMDAVVCVCVCACVGRYVCVCIVGWADWAGLA